MTQRGFDYTRTRPVQFRYMKRVTPKKATEKSRKRKTKGRQPSRRGLDFSLQSTGQSTGQSTSQTAGQSTGPSSGERSSHSSNPGKDPRKVHPKEQDKELCENCSKDLSGTERALFVEEEIGRIFCSESCIAAFFTPEISRLEKEYFRRLSPSDLGSEEKEKLSHLRWMTLQDPDEVWREKTLSGDYRYTMISEFQPENRFIWSICICLFLRGEPSFLFMAFQTKNAAMVASYRKGERVQWEKSHNSDYSHMDENYQGPKTSGIVDGLADAWTEEETQRAQVTQKRKIDDVAMSDFVLYESCVDETLEAPDEVWSIKAPENSPYQVYHFIRYYPEETPGIWYVVIARETEDAGQIEILDTFPTRDSSLVDRYRKGFQEIGQPEEPLSARVVH